MPLRGEGSCGGGGAKESDTTERLHFHFSFSCIGEGNGNPLQCSCLEIPRDGGAWWAAVYGVAQSQTRLKLFSTLWGFPSGSDGKESTCNVGDAGDVGSIPGSGRSPGPRAAAPVGVFSRGTTRISGSLSPTLCDPRDGSPPGSPVPGNLQARTLEWVAISFSSARVRLCATP